uniref:protein S100-A11-like n=1 Tax=Callithrix jacchus TaxID=9483 RepID=UPI0023DD5D06|nr:protein S100-A11-like [Callithrix jacchus]
MAKISSPAETEWCIESLIAVFQKFAGKDGYNCTVSKMEFLRFMNTELAAFTKNPKDPSGLDHTMKKLDVNSDGQLDFPECLYLTGGLAVACNDSFLKDPLGLAFKPTLFFQPFYHHLLLTAHMSPEPSTPTTSCRPHLWIVIK